MKSYLGPCSSHSSGDMNKQLSIFMPDINGWCVQQGLEAWTGVCSLPCHSSIAKQNSDIEYSIYIKSKEDFQTKSFATSFDFNPFYLLNKLVLRPVPLIIHGTSQIVGALGTLQSSDM